MCRRFVYAIAILLGVALLSDIAWAEKREEKDDSAHLRTDYVDMGIKLVVVEADPSGRPIVPGNTEKMRIVGEPIIRGGIVKMYRGADGKPAARIVRQSRNPIVWYVSQPQADLILHDGNVPWVLVQGSEGSGKTTVLAMWTAFRVLEHIGTSNEIGLTAPTSGRLAHAMKKIRDHWPSRWYHHNKTDKRFAFHAGPVVQMVSAAQRSEEGGSPLQGFDFVAHAGDEWQDHFSLEDDAIARGRGAPDMRRPDGSIAPKWYPRLLTSTFKDSTGWRNFRAAANTNTKDWFVARLLGLESPFIGSEHWERFRRGVTEREYRRRVLAEDVGPENQVYYSWSREFSVQPLPSGAAALHAEDVTAEVLREWGANVHVLAGHDPGKRQHVTVFLKAFRFAADVRRGDRLPRWFVVGEVTSPESVVESHVQEVLKYARERWAVNEVAKDRFGNVIPSDPGARKMLVRVDPHSRSGDSHPGRDVYSIWRSFGVLTRAAAYDGNKPAVIKKDSRINLVNTLLCNADGVRRLFIASDERGQPLAKRTVESFESLERDASDEAETEKGPGDASHWSVSVGYSLWQVERRNVVLREAA